MRNKSDKDLWKQFENQQLKATYDISTHVLYSWITCMYTQVFTNWQMQINLNECFFAMEKLLYTVWVVYHKLLVLLFFFFCIHFSYFIHICLFPFHSLNFHLIWFFLYFLQAWLFHHHSFPCFQFYWLQLIDFYTYQMDWDTSNTCFPIGFDFWLWYHGLLVSRLMWLMSYTLGKLLFDLLKTRFCLCLRFFLWAF